MRIFESLEEMINEVTRDLFSRGKKVFDTTVQAKTVVGKEYSQKELLGYAFTVNDTSDAEKMLEWSRKTFNKPHLSKLHAEGWFQDIISGKPLNPEPSWVYFQDYWEKFGLESDRRFSYTYSERLLMLPQIIDALKKNPYRRGAVITVYNTPQDAANIGKRRVPCSMYFQFLVRDDPIIGPQLHIIYNMRSCDFVNFFPLDIYRAAALKKYVAEKLEIGEGSLTMFIGTLHAYNLDVPEDRKW